MARLLERLKAQDEALAKKEQVPGSRGPIWDAAACSIIYNPHKGGMARFPALVSSLRVSYPITVCVDVNIALHKPSSFISY